MLINLSNHPSAKWSAKQLQAAHQFGDIVDLPFPDVNPEADEQSVIALANSYASKVETLASEDEVTVHVMGEMNFIYSFVKRMRERGIACVASTTKRIVKELPNGQKESVFQFVKFRRYE